MASKPKNRAPQMIASDGKAAAVRYAAHMIALEPRMMFDGAAIISAADALTPAGTIVAGMLPESLGLIDLDRPATDWSPIADHAMHTGWATPPSDRVVLDFSEVMGDDPVSTGGGAYRGLDHRNADTLDDRAVADVGNAAPSTEIIFIDSAVTGYQTLVAEWRWLGTNGRSARRPLRRQRHSYCQSRGRRRVLARSDAGRC
jgi:hypothetical protein